MLGPASSRRGFLFHKNRETKQQATTDNSKRFHQHLQQHKAIPTEQRSEALNLMNELRKQDVKEELRRTDVDDDEYQWADVENTQIIITTSRNPSSRLKMIIEELKLIIPNSQSMNRGNYSMKKLIDDCQARGITDFIIVHEHNDVPNTLVICRLPQGPTSYFTILEVVMKSDVSDIDIAAEQYPHVVFHNFKTPLGIRIVNIMKCLYPIRNENSKRIITFVNHKDYIFIRQHLYEEVAGKRIELTEVGPRFQLQLYKIKSGTNTVDVETDWALRRFVNTDVKSKFLSSEKGWSSDEDIE